MNAHHPAQTTIRPRTHARSHAQTHAHAHAQAHQTTSTTSSSSSPPSSPGPTSRPSRPRPRPHPYPLQGTPLLPGRLEPLTTGGGGGQLQPPAGDDPLQACKFEPLFEPLRARPATVNVRTQEAIEVNTHFYSFLGREYPRFCSSRFEQNRGYSRVPPPRKRFGAEPRPARRGAAEAQCVLASVLSPSVTGAVIRRDRCRDPLPAP